jgi:hypothetical protein
MPPLATQSLNLIRHLPSCSPWVFANPRDPSRHINAQSLAARLGSADDALHLRDYRRVFEAWAMDETGRRVFDSMLINTALDRWDVRDNGLLQRNSMPL